MVGCNFLPSTAINQLEMSQADTFDPLTIDRELRWAAWRTWQFPILGEPDPWHHDIFRVDGTPYSEDEVQLIRRLISR
jgi:hypothetical protein